MKWTINQIIGCILSVVGILFCVAQFVMSVLIVQHANDVKLTDATWPDFLIQLVAFGYAPYAVGIVLIICGCYVLTRPSQSNTAITAVE
jgi:hypothetical protein